MDQPTVFEGSLTPQGEIAIGSGTLLDGELVGDLTAVFTLNEIPGIGPTVFHVDLSEGSKTALATLVGGKQVVKTPNDRVYVMSAEQLLCIDVASVPPAIETIGLPFPGSALAYDSFRNEIVVLSASTNRLLRFVDLAHPPIVMLLPTPIAVNADTNVQVNPRDGMYWFASPNSNVLRGWNPVGPVALYDQITLPAVQEPISIDFDDAGAIYICTGDAVVAMNNVPGGAWEVMQDFNFNLPQGAKLFKVTNSETNFNPEVHNGPGYVNIDPDSLSLGELEIDCYSDLNRDRTVDVDDLLMLINSWGPCPAGPCVSDVNGNRATDVDDLLQLINAWGACP
jgi:hypothetical protein